MDLARPFGLVLEPTIPLPIPETTDIIFNNPNPTPPINYDFSLPCNSPALPPVFPGFLRPLPARIDATDTQYLQAKGALTLPSLEFQNALLKAFVEYVHPYMPVLDLGGFLNIVYHRDGSRGQTSLVLYQAVMFSGAGFVSMDELHKNGYSSRKEARRALLQRARVSRFYPVSKSYVKNIEELWLTDA